MSHTSMEITGSAPVADEDDGLFHHPFDLQKELEIHRDMVLGFALCNFQHHETRRDVKKAQEHVTAILAALRK